MGDPVRDSAATPRAGELIAGKYLVERQLGAGGMGVVLSARHVDLGEQFAIKVVSPAFAKHPEAVGRFMREARAAARIKSEHVARVHDVGKLESGAPYMVMEHLTGIDLDRVVRERGPLPIDEALDYVLQACEAIAEAHAAGIIHRDLKPANLFLAHRADGSPLVKVLDFGMSKVTEGAVPDQSITATAAILGSPHYMSPEQVRSSKTIDARSDVWSLGVVLHKLLTGTQAFDAVTLSACLAKIVADPPGRLRDHRPAAPAALESVILRCLEKDVGSRLQSVAVLARALEPLAPRSRLSVERIVKVLEGQDAPAGQTVLLANPSPAPPAQTPLALPAAPPTLLLVEPEPATLCLPNRAPLPSIPDQPPTAGSVSGAWAPSRPVQPKRGRALIALGGIVVLIGSALVAWRLASGPAEPTAGGSAATPAPVATTAPPATMAAPAVIETRAVPEAPSPHPVPSSTAFAPAPTVVATPAPRKTSVATPPVAEPPAAKPRTDKKPKSSIERDL